MGFVADAEQPRFTPDAAEAQPPAKKKAFSFGGDSNLNAAEAFGALNRLLDRTAYKAGEVTSDTLAKVLPPDLAAAGGLAANVAVQAGPMLLGGEGAKVASPALESGARRLMSSALKPTWKSLRTGKAAKAIDTMLEEGFNATKGGVEKMKALIGDLNDQVSKAIAGSPATIDKNAVASRLQDTLKNFEMQVNPGADTAAITKAWNEFLAHPMLAGKNTMPVQLAQDLKKGTYRSLGEKSYGELKGAEVEAQKGLARGLKEEISAAVPEVAPLNARESGLINASNIAERRAMLQDNNNIGGLAWLSHDPMAAAGFMADKSALVKSILARGMYSGSEQIPATGARLGIAGLLAPEGQPEGGNGILSKRIAWMGSKQHGSD